MLLEKKEYLLAYREVMLNPDIALTEKAMYAYLISQCNDNGTCELSRKTIMSDLGISSDACTKYTNLLASHFYIDINLIIENNGRVSHNEYVIMPVAIKKTLNEEESNQMEGLK